MNIYEMTMNEYLNQAASKSPTPGGGSVSAVVAANAAAMISMVANLTLGKKGYEEVQDDIRAILNVTGKLISDIKELTEKDMQVFQKFMDAWRLPSVTEEDKVRKSVAMEEAAQRASLVPMELGRVCIAILEEAVKLAPIGNKSAISDAGVGAYLADAALKSAMLGVDINMPLVKNEVFKENLLTERANIEKEAEKLKTSALAEVGRRLQ